MSDLQSPPEALPQLEVPGHVEINDVLVESLLTRYPTVLERLPDYGGDAVGDDVYGSAEHPLAFFFNRWTLTLVSREGVIELATTDSDEFQQNAGALSTPQNKPGIQTIVTYVGKQRASGKLEPYETSHRRFDLPTGSVSGQFRVYDYTPEITDRLVEALREKAQEIKDDF